MATCKACTTVIANRETDRAWGWAETRCSAVHSVTDRATLTGSRGTNCTCMVASCHSYLAQEASVLCKSVPSSALSMERQWWWLNVLCSHSNTPERHIAVRFPVTSGHGNKHVISIHNFWQLVTPAPAFARDESTREPLLNAAPVILLPEGEEPGARLVQLHTQTICWVHTSVLHVPTW